nr:uncharacterized protein LOC129453462 isoform X2 [Misgurnus anguillicaudatus]
MKTIYLLFMIFGVFGDEVKSVSVIEGDSLTLYTHLTDTQADDVTVTWTFGPQKTYIAQINREAKETYIYADVLGGRFRDRLQLNNQTGDLTITNFTTKDSGLYEVEITVRSKIIHKSFKVTGVVGAGGVKSVSVKDGDSVTLHTDDPDIKKYDVILWRFQHGNSPLAELNRNTAIFSTYDDVLNGIFKGRLQLDVQTGSLDIRNIRTKHSGFYEVDITSTSSNYTIHQSFTVTVSGEVKSVSVMKGDSVTLQTRLTEIQRDDLIVWMFLPDDTQIAQIYKLNNLFRTYDGEDGRFRDRLKLNDQNGDLTITNSKTEHTGDYEVKMNIRRQTIQRRISVHVSGGLSSGGIAGLSVFILLLIAALAALLIYFKQKIAELQKQQYKEITVKDGHCAVIHTGLKVKAGDEIEWGFRQKDAVIMWPWRPLIAKHDKEGSITYNCPHKRFRDKLKLQPETGDLVISNVSNEHSGVYHLKITSGGETSHRRFKVSVIERILADKDESVNLKTEVTDIKRDDGIEWRFGETLIAKINPANKSPITYDDDKGLFRDKLKLNHQTGDLTIKDIRHEHTGDYILKIIRDGKTSDKRFRVFVRGGREKRLVDEGKSVDLKTEVTDIQKDDVIEWRFGDEETVIAKINHANNIFITFDDDLFRDKLKLNDQTGDLTINDIRQKHGGVYLLKIIRGGKTSYARFIVFVYGGNEEILHRSEGASVSLETKVTDIKRDDLIEWTFENEETLIAKINPVNNIFSTYDGDDDLFRDKLELNDQTGNLNINDITVEHSGVYKLKIIRDGKTSYKRFIVSVRCKIEKLIVYKGDSVHLETEVTDIKKDVLIEWKFRKTLIAEIKPVNNIFSTYNGDDDLFRDILELNHQTGNLNINNTREEHTGEYLLKITKDRKTSCKKFNVFVRGDKEELHVCEGKSVDLKTEVTDIQTVDKIQWITGDEETSPPFAAINPAKNIFSTYDGVEGLFSDELKLNRQTGDLNINDFRQKHARDYTLKITRDGETSYKRFRVLVKVSVDEGESCNLKPSLTDIRTIRLIEWRFGETLIAKIIPFNKFFRTYDGDGNLFKDKLKLNHQTGDLNINDITRKHAGVYTMRIMKFDTPSYRRFILSVKASRGEDLARKRGDPVRKRGEGSVEKIEIDSVEIEMPLLPNSTFKKGEGSVEIEMPLLNNSSQ